MTKGKPALAILALWSCGALAAMQGPAPAGTPDTDALLKRRDPAALAELERRFDASEDKIERQKIASVLVRRLERDAVYFDFLAEHARRAVESDMPFPFVFDVEGKRVPRQYTAEFLRWANEKRIFPDTAASYAINEAPLDVLALALADDPRAAGLLLEGVGSPNYMVAYQAAFGLARLRMASAVPRIVAVAEAAPREIGELMGRALVFFDSPEAQAAAARLIRDEKVLAALRMQAKRQLEMNIGGS